MSESYCKHGLSIHAGCQACRIEELEGGHFAQAIAVAADCEMSDHARKARERLIAAGLDNFGAKAERIIRQAIAAASAERDQPLPIAAGSTALIAECCALKEQLAEQTRRLQQLGAQLDSVQGALADAGNEFKTLDHAEAVRELTRERDGLREKVAALEATQGENA